MKEYKADITVFIDRGDNMPLATQLFKTQGTRNQVLKDVKSIIDKFPALGRGNICVQIKDLKK